MATPAPQQNPNMSAQPTQGGEAPQAAPVASSNHPHGSLYVGDLAPEVTEAFLFEIFNPVGPVSSIRVCRDSTTRRSLGYAYVNFHSAQDAERALDTLNFFTIKDRPCRIMWSHRDPSIRKNPSANIFIKNLSKDIDNKELFDTFSQFGNILSCKVATDINGASQGYGFVHFSEEKDALKAIEKVNGKLLKDKKVYVGKFERRQDRMGTGAGQHYTNVYVKNVPEDWTQQKFEETFSKFGKITSAVLRVDESGKSKGFGFVNYETHDQASKAVEEGSKITAGDKTLFVDRFQKKAERRAILSKRYEELRREKSEKYKNLNLYVKNLEEDVDDAKLREMFEPYGEITSAVVMKDGKASKGFGFVCYANADDATKALNEMNNKMCGTKPIYVNRAQRKEERQAQLQSQFAQPMAGGPRMPMMYFQPTMGMSQPAMMYPSMMRHNPRMPMRYGGPAPFNPQQQQRAPRSAGPGGRPMHAGNMRSAQPMPGAGQQKFRGAPPNARFPQAQMPVVAPPVTTQTGMIGSDLTTMLANATSPEARKQILGEQLFPKVQIEQPQLAAKITGMLLEMEVSEILALLDSPAELKNKIAEALEVLGAHSKPEGQ